MLERKEIRTQPAVSDPLEAEKGTLAVGAIETAADQ